jgi:hypothetical protein
MPPSPTQEEIAARNARRQIEDALLELGAERDRLEHEAAINQQRIRALLEPARQADISVRDIARMTGVSTQTLHAWQRELMRPIPALHFGLLGPAPTDLAEAVLRTMGEDPNREWTAPAVSAAIPAAWPNGSAHQVQLALTMLARSLQIWQTEEGFRISPPADAMWYSSAD